MTLPPQRFPGLVGLLAIASLSFWAAACGSNSPSNTGSGGAGMSTGGATATGGASSGGNLGSTGGSGSGGVTGSGGVATGGVTGSGGVATGGVTGSGGVATGGVTGSGGKTSDGGASGTGGASGGATGGGGKANNGGKTGGAGGKASSGGMIGDGGTMGAGGMGAFTLTSPGWMNMTGCASNMAASCGTLPKELTRTGGGVGTSPELNWTGAPAGTKSFAVVLQDISGNSTHWALWNIPGTSSNLAAHVDGTTATPAVPAGSQQCSKDPAAAAGAEGYYGPGACGNVYEFTLYALGVTPFSPTMATDEKQVRTQLLALGTSILGTATLRGRTFAPNCP